jgi:hypothetical protein
MKRIITTLGASLVVALVVAAMLGNTAFASEVPQNLPFSVSTQAFTGKNVGKIKLNSGADNIECETASVEGTEAPGAAGQIPHGTFHITLEHCKEEKFKQTCANAGDPTSFILMLGTWDLPWDRKISGTFELTVGTLLFLTRTSLECTALAKIEVEGSQLCLDLEATLLSFTHDDHCLPFSLGSPKQSEEYCFLDLNPCTPWIIPDLSARLNGGKSEPAAEEWLWSWTFPFLIAADAL